MPKLIIMPELLIKEEFMKKIILTILVSFLSLSAFAERFVMVTHGEGKDPFWPVVQKGGHAASGSGNVNVGD